MKTKRINYFKDCKDMKEVKSLYKKLIKENHPDIGGDVATMQDINIQFEVAFNLKREKPSDKAGYYADLYNIECGVNYSSYLMAWDIIKIVRSYIKSKYNDCRFSITLDNYSAIRVIIRETPYPLLKSDDILKEYLRLNKYKLNCGDGYTLEEFKKHIERGYDINYMEDKAKAFLSDDLVNICLDINNFINSYNRTDSDIMRDYYNTNFYYFGYIGEWDRVYKQVARTRKPSKMVLN